MIFPKSQQRIAQFRFFLASGKISVLLFKNVSVQNFTKITSGALVSDNGGFLGTT